MLTTLFLSSLHLHHHLHRRRRRHHSRCHHHHHQVLQTYSHWHMETTNLVAMPAADGQLKFNNIEKN